MLYFAFCMGMLLGLFLGILIAGLCRMASERNRSSFDDPYFTGEFSLQANGSERNMDEVFR